jgi:hypothetical protein
VSVTWLHKQEFKPGSAHLADCSLHETGFIMWEFPTPLCHPSLPRLRHQNDTHHSG